LSSSDPIPVPDGRGLKTLHDAGHYATALPRALQELAAWQTAAEMLILAACVIATALAAQEVPRKGQKRS
jgi:hypothetical protein